MKENLNSQWLNIKKKTISNRICWFKIEQGLDSISKKNSQLETLTNFK